MADDHAGDLERLTAWAKGRNLSVRAILGNVELLPSWHLGVPIIERRGQTKDDAAFYIINCLHALGVDVSSADE